MKTVLYIAPHLSTGGLPQYLYKKIKSLIKEEDLHIYLIEWSDITGGVLTVQRDKLRKLLWKSYQFETLGDDKTALFTLINKINPDIIHLEEIPELFMDFDIATDLYHPNRKYSIVETSHDSSFNLESKLFFPDKFMMVSQFQVDKYKTLDIPTVLIEYPIEHKKRPNRKRALEKLGLDPNKKHVLNVGLFTPRKNQKEFFDYARSLPEYEFHCVGNQASNFKHYWGPLMENKPDNVTWWGERRDVDNFYKCMDLFLFTSEGNEGDKETMPLVLKEALSWNMNILIYNLPVYLDYFDKYDNVFYLSKDKGLNENKIRVLLDSTIYKKLNLEIKNNQKECFIISTYPITKSITETTKKCIESIKSKGYDIILTSHCPVPKELQEMVDYVVYDKNNILTKHTFYKNSWYKVKNQFEAHINLEGENNDLYHGPTVYTNYYNGASLAQRLGYQDCYFINYDYILKPEFNFELFNIDTHKAVFGKCDASEGPSLYTYFLKCSLDFYLDKVPLISNIEEYEDLWKRIGSESNGLENMFYHLFKNNKSSLFIYPQEDFTKLSEENLHHENYSQVEYMTVLPVVNRKMSFTPFIQISNEKDSRIVEVEVNKGLDMILQTSQKVEGKFVFQHPIFFENLNDEFDVVMTLKNEEGEILKESHIVVNLDYYNTQLPKNGSFKLEKSYPLTLIHLVTDPTKNPKEIESTKNLKDFCNTLGFNYVPIENEIYTKLPPKKNCARPQDIDSKPGHYKLSPGHYGCYKAHTNAILNLNQKDTTIVVFEGDTIIDVDYGELYQKLIEWDNIMVKNNLDFVGFGNPTSGKNEIIEGDILKNKLIPAQSYIINTLKLKEIQDKIRSSKWDAYDMFITNNFNTASPNKIYTKHLPGFSIVDQKEKNADNDNPLIFKK